MPDNQDNTDRTSPLADLTAEALQHLDAIKGELDRATGDLDAFEELGIDMSRLRERIDWGKKAREVVLKRFGNGRK